MKNHRTSFVRNESEKVHIAFPVDAKFYDQFAAVLERGMQGEKITAELSPLMEKFAHYAFEAFYKDSLGSIKLGFIGSKLVDVGGVAIGKGSQTAVRHLMPTLEGENIKRFCGYFHGMLMRNPS